MTIGEKIQTIRIEKGLTQEHLAELLEVSRQSVSKWELGQAIPDVDKIIRLKKKETLLRRQMIINSCRTTGWRICPRNTHG